MGMTWIMGYLHNERYVIKISSISLFTFHLTLINWKLSNGYSKDMSKCQAKFIDNSIWTLHEQQKPNHRMENYLWIIEVAITYKPVFKIYFHKSYSKFYIFKIQIIIDYLICIKHIYY